MILPMKKLLNMRDDLIEALFPEEHSSSREYGENEVSRIKFEHQNATTDLIRWIRKTVRTT